MIVATTLFITTLVYANSLNHGFINFDDPENIVDNYSIRELNWANIEHYFTTPLQFMYTPLVSISYALDYQVGQLDPGVYHLTNLVLHLCNVVLVFLVFYALTRKAFVSHAVTVLFALHPMNVDAISWIATRSNLLASLFSLAALLAYTYYVRKERYWLLALATFCFLLATFCKSSAVALPVALFLWDYYLERRISWKLLIEKIPFFVISLVMGLVALNFRVDTNVLYDYSLLDRFILICAALVSYLIKAVVPYPLAFAYGYPATTGGHLPWHLYLTPLILLLIGWGLYKLLPRRVLVLGLGFFVINILLSQTTLLVDNYHSNRYAYLPYLGLYFILAFLAERFLITDRVWRPWLQFAGPAALVLVVVVFASLTFVRNGLWKDTITLLDDSIKHDASVPFIYNTRGISKYKIGDNTGATADFDKTIALDPNFSLSYYYRGLIKFNAGDFQGAVADFDTALSHSADLVAGYADRGKAKVELKDYDGALADFTQAIALNGYYVDAYLNRGILNVNVGRFQEAIADYNKVIEYSPDLAIAYNNRGSAEIELGDNQGALNDFSKATQLDPGYTDAFANLGVAKLRLNDTAGACSDWRKALAMGSQTAGQLIQENKCPE